MMYNDGIKKHHYNNVIDQYSNLKSSKIRTSRNYSTHTNKTKFIYFVYTQLKQILTITITIILIKNNTIWQIILFGNQIKTNVIKSLIGLITKN